MADRTGRPKINAEWSFTEKILQLVSILILAGNLVLLITAWGKLPSTVPTHFGFFGAPDGYGEKSRLLMLPILAAGFYLLFTIIERFPWVCNFPIEITGQNAKYEYQTMREMLVCAKAELLAVFTYILLGQIKTAEGAWHGLGGWFLTAFLAVLALTLAYYIIRMLRHKNGGQSA